MVTLLGGVAVRRHGELVRAASTRAVGLLGYLVLTAPAAQPRQHLAGVFWPDTTESQARTNLRRELHLLRQLVPSECLDVTDTTIAWLDRETCTVDVRTFASRAAAVRARLASGDRDTDRHVDRELAELGRQAVDAYAGNFLPGLYDDWVVEARETLRRQCV